MEIVEEGVIVFNEEYGSLRRLHWTIVHVAKILKPACATRTCLRIPKRNVHEVFVADRVEVERRAGRTGYQDGAIERKHQILNVKEQYFPWTIGLIPKTDRRFLDQQ